MSTKFPACGALSRLARPRQRCSKSRAGFAARCTGRKVACGSDLSAAKLWVPAGARALLASQIWLKARVRDPKRARSPRGRIGLEVPRRCACGTPSLKRSGFSALERVSGEPGEGDIHQSLPPRSTVQNGDGSGWRICTCR